MFLRICRLILFIAYFFCVTSVAADPGPNNPIIIGCDPDFPPYEFVTISGEPAGLNIDLSHAISESMGNNVRFRYAPKHELRRQLMTGQIDILSGVAYTEDLSHKLDFTPPHAQIYQSLWVRKDSSLRSLSDLKGSKVMVVRGEIMQDYLQQHPQLGVQSIPVDSLEDALRLLSIGEYDAALGGKLSGEYLLGRLQIDQLKTVGKPLLTQEYGFAVKAGNREMLSLVTEGLALLKQSGRYREIFNEWIGPLPQQKGISFRRVLNIGALILGPLLIGLALMVLWSTTLRRQVRQRTAALKQEVAEREQAMKELERRQQQLIQADKLASLGVLTSGIAHEINNPNALLLLNLPQLHRAWQDIAPILELHYNNQGDFDLGRIPYSQMRNEIPEMLDEMLASAERIKRIVADLKNFVRRHEQVTMDSLNLNEVAKTAIRLLKNPLEKATKYFSISFQEPLPPIHGNSQRLEQVIVNLLLNAVQSLKNTDQAITLTTFSTAQDIILEVTDQGKGIAPEHMDQLTDPFFTTKRQAGGTGLGLSVSMGIVNEHGGTLEFTSTAGFGTKVKLSLPRKG
jgi:polar amino acid transport system substrate-binding protein